MRRTTTRTITITVAAAICLSLMGATTRALAREGSDVQDRVPAADATTLDDSLRVPVAVDGGEGQQLASDAGVAQSATSVEEEETAPEQGDAEQGYVTDDQAGQLPSDEPSTPTGEQAVPAENQGSDDTDGAPSTDGMQPGEDTGVPAADDSATEEAQADEGQGTDVSGQPLEATQPAPDDDADAAAPKPAPSKKAAPAVSSAPAKKAAEKEATAAKGAAALAAGTYWIESGAAYHEVLDVQGGSKSLKANVQIYHSNKSAAQRWKLVYDAKTGLYTILNAKTGFALDVQDGLAKAGANVRMYRSNGSRAQKWKLVGDSKKGFVLVSALSDKLCLDVTGGSATDGTNIRLWNRNGSRAQRFWAVPTSGVAGSKGAAVPDGAYTISIAGYALDVAGGSGAKGSNVQAYKGNGSLAQKWYLTFRNGYYTISHVGTGNALDVAGGAVTPAANVRVWSANRSNAQLWRIDKAGNGYKLVNKATGFVVNLVGNKRANGTNIDVFRDNGSGAQKWTLSKTGLLSTGCYTICANPSSAGSLEAGSGTSVRAAKTSGSMAQKWMVSSMGSGQYGLQSVDTGSWLSTAGSEDTSVTQSSSKAAWKPVWLGNGLGLERGGKVITLSASGSGAKPVILANEGAAKVQRLTVTPCALIKDGFYTITMGNLALDVKGAGTKKGVNIDVYKKNGTAAQVFSISKNADGTYTVINDISGMAVEVARAGKADGANVRQWRGNDSAAQKWKIAWKNGTFEFTNVATGRKLSTVKGAASGANVTSSNKGATGWHLQSAAPIRTSGDATLDREMQSIVSSCGTGIRGFRRAFQYISDHYRYRNGNVYPQGKWTSWSTGYAREMYEKRSGNCYRFASILGWAARSMGFSAQVVSGEVLEYGGWWHHGWITINHAGKQLCYDVEMYQKFKKKGFFGNTYDEMPVYYRLID